MTISNQEECKVHQDQQTLSIQFDVEKQIWEVACWNNKDDSCQWYKEFKNEIDARKEYEKFKR